jgi:DNA-binding winged helix-turn-helix (wHTH) protein
MKYFGGFRFDVREQTLWFGADQIRLTRKAAALLTCLIEEPGSWITKSAILLRVWPDTHVHPDNIKVLIHEIRVALGDDSRCPRYIGSEPKRGYVFVAPVTGSGSGDALDERNRQARPIFVHRGPELEALMEEFAAMLAGEARAVILTGDPGAGKSAILHTFLRTARVFHPFRQLSLTSGSRSGSGRPTMASSNDLGPNRERVVTPSPPEPDLPLVIVVEALDTGDRTLRERLASLIAGRRAERMLIVATSRRGGVEQPFELSASVRTRYIAIPALNQVQIRRYLSVRLGMPERPGLAAAMHAATGGNARAVAALTDVLVERGLVAQTPDGWMAVADPKTTADMVPGFGSCARDARNARPRAEGEARRVKHARPRPLRRTSRYLSRGSSSEMFE